MRADEADEAALVAHATALAGGIESALAGWVERVVRHRCEQAGRPVDEELAQRARAAGEQCRDDIAPRVRALLMADVDQQDDTPLALLRRAVVHPTRVLAAAGVPPVERDEFDQRALPGDLYGLAPATFADLDERLAEPGLIWGAAKAHVHLARRRAEGLR